MFSEEIAELMKVDKKRGVKLVNQKNKEAIEELNEVLSNGFGIELTSFQSKPSSLYSYSHRFDYRENTIKCKMGSTSFNLRLPIEENNQVVDLGMVREAILNANLRITYVSQEKWFNELKEKISQAYDKEKLYKDLAKNLSNALESQPINQVKTERKVVQKI